MPLLLVSLLANRGIHEYPHPVSPADLTGLSFSTATIHYGPKRGECSVIDRGAVYLCDSGAQYMDGTTDVTRTLHFGQPTDFEKRAYTLVLKGHIGLDSAVFPKGTTGFALDALARQHLWVGQYPK